MAGLEEELASEGISFVGGTDPADNTLAPPSVIPDDPSVGAVVVGLDTSINYTKLSKAFRYLHSDPSVVFLATNDDSTYPSASGLLPGAGSILAPLRYALGPTRPPLSLGKPSVSMLDAIKAKHDFDPARTLMIGDRLNTDIQFGKAGGLSTLLVLTGIAKEADLDGSDVVPDYITASIGDLIAVGKPPA
ncbi:HAD-like protein [Artomyces pyxidatus]|uniref:HAD-like protein n=1 Tax=Artomyces pyxidatus TaxID=48021 RepID=A0ACB8T2Z0_9AGAM|nr:HAD-like protein [Artomyces pyxidatus]